MPHIAATAPVGAGGGTAARLHAVPPIPWSEEYQAAYLDMNHRVFDRVETVVGEQQVR